MADYKIRVGTELDTSGIKTKIDGYKGEVTVGSTLDTGGITRTLNAYKPRPLNVNTKLSTTGITKAIQSYKAKDIKVGIIPDFTGIETAISNKTFNTPIKVNVQLNWAGVAKQIANPVLGTGAMPKVNLDVALNDDAIAKAIDFWANNNASKKIPLKIKPIIEQFNLDQVETLLENYTARTPLKVNVELLKGRINDQIKEYNQTAQSDNGRTVLLRARLTDNAVSEAISNYKTGNAERLKIPIDLTFNSNTEFDTKLKQRIQAYKNTPVEIPVRLKPSEKNFSNQIAKTPVYIEAVLKNPENISKAIKAYVDNPVLVPVKLTPSATGFSDGVTKTPIKINATLKPDSINNAIDAFRPTSRLKVDVKLVPTNINTEVAKLPKPIEPLSVNVKLNESNINTEIALFKPTATLGIKPDLMIEDVDAQIAAYTPKVPLKVNVLLENNLSNDGALGKNMQTPITVGVNLDREKLNQQIRDFKTSTKIRVGVKLDFASHKDEAGKEIQKGIAQQIKAYSTKAKVKVGVELDRNSINQEVQNIQVGTPVRLLVELNTENVQTQINNIRQQLQELGNIRINLGDIGNGGGTSYNSANTQKVIQEQKELAVTSAQTANAVAQSGEKVRQAFVQMTSIGNLDPIKLQDDISEADRFAAALNRLKNIQRNILKVDTIKVNTSNGVQQLKTLELQLESLSSEYNKTVAEINGMGGVSATQFQTLINQANTTALYIDRLKQKIVDLKTASASKITSSFSDYDNQVLSLQNRFSALTNQLPETKNRIDLVKQALDTLKSADGIEDIIAKNDKYKEILKQVQAELTKLETIEKGANTQQKFAAAKEAAMRKLNSMFQEGSAAAKKYSGYVEQLRNELNSCGNIQGIQNVTKKINALGTEIKQTSTQTKTFSSRLKEQFSKYSNYLSIASVFMYATRAMRSMFEQVKLIDSAMTELKKVTDESEASYNKFLKNAASRSKELGTTIDGLVSSTADFARLGYSFEESQKLAEVANIYTVVGDEIEGVEGATKSLISTLAAFKDEASGISDADFAMDIIDIFNELGKLIA